MAPNYYSIRHLDTRGNRPDEFEHYFRQQPHNSVAIFFRSSEADYIRLSKKFGDMLVRAYQIVNQHGTCGSYAARTLLLNIEEIRQLEI